MFSDECSQFFFFFSLARRSRFLTWPSRWKRPCPNDVISLFLISPRPWLTERRARQLTFNRAASLSLCVLPSQYSPGRRVSFLWRPNEEKERGKKNAQSCVDCSFFFFSPFSSTIANNYFSTKSFALRQTTRVSEQNPSRDLVTWP